MRHQLLIIFFVLIFSATAKQQSTPPHDVAGSYRERTLQLPHTFPSPKALPSRASLGVPPDAPLNVFPATCTQWASGISWIAGIYWYSGSQVGYILANDSMVYPPVQNFNSLSDIIPLFYQVLTPLCTSAALLLGQTASVPLINPNTTLPFTYVRTFNSLSGNLYAYSSDGSVQISTTNSSYINLKVNVTEINSGVASISSSDGSMNYNSSTGAVIGNILNPSNGTVNTPTPRTLISKLNDLISVTDYGALCNGVADDSTAINNAIAGVVGGRVIFPEGKITCAIANSILLRNNVMLALHSGVTIQWIGASNGIMFTNYNISSPLLASGLLSSYATIDPNGMTQYIFSLHSPQGCKFGNFHILGGNSSATIIYNIIADAGTGQAANALFNIFDYFSMLTGQVYGIIQISGMGPLNGPPTTLATLNTFQGFFVNHASAFGISEVQWADSNTYYSCTLNLGSNGIGVILNNSPYPTGNVGIYDIYFAFIEIDPDFGATNTTGFLINYSYGCIIESFYTAGLTTQVNYNNLGSGSFFLRDSGGYIVEYSTKYYHYAEYNNANGPLFNFWKTRGGYTGAIQVGDHLGTINWVGTNADSELATFAQLFVTATNVSNATESGDFYINLNNQGTIGKAIGIHSDGRVGFGSQQFCFNTPAIIGIQPSLPTQSALYIQGATGQSANYITVITNTSSTLFSINATGTMDLGGCFLTSSGSLITTSCPISGAGGVASISNTDGNIQLNSSTGNVLLNFNPAYFYFAYYTDGAGSFGFTSSIGQGAGNSHGATNATNWDVNNLGYQAGQYNNGFSVNNLGYQAGQYNTANSVNNNGHQAGQYNTGAQVNNNGYQAGQYNTGSNVNNLGYQAGQYNTGAQVNNNGQQAGQYNTGTNVNNNGYQAGQYNTGAHVNNNGQQAGQYNTGSNVNNIGYQAGQYNTGAQVNNIGHQAGQYNTGSNVNNIGYQAGQNNTANYVNNIGQQAGQYNNGTNVNNNGYQAGQNNTGAQVNNNGHQAGQYNTANYVNNLGESGRSVQHWCPSQQHRSTGRSEQHWNQCQQHRLTGRSEQ